MNKYDEYLNKRLIQLHLDGKLKITYSLKSILKEGYYLCSGAKPYRYVNGEPHYTEAQFWTNKNTDTSYFVEDPNELKYGGQTDEFSFTNN